MNPNYELEEIEDKNLIKLVRMLIDYYHAQGMVKGGGAGRNSRYFAYLQKEDDRKYIVAVAWLHDNTPFRFIAQQYNIPDDRSYFIRRITKTAPGDHLINFLNDLAEKLRNDGFEVLWTLGFPDHSNALYKKAGFKLVGVTNRTKHEVYVKYLNK